MNISFLFLRSSILIILCLTLNLSLRAQDEKPKFGKVSMADLKMTRYDKDTSAEAVILSDLGQTYFDYDQTTGFVMIHDRFLRIKIITKDGYPFAYQSIPLHKNKNEEEQVDALKASTFNLVDGKIVESKMDNKSVFDDESDAYETIKKFTLPSVKEGSVLDIHYKIRSPFFFYLRPWGFQDVIPERYSEYEVRIPEFFTYKAQYSGYYPLYTNETKSNNTSWYVEQVRLMATKDVPAMKSEMYTSSMKNYHTGIEFELNAYKFPNSDYVDLSSSWDKIIHRLLMDDDFGEQLKKTGIMKDAAQSLKSKTNDPLELMTLAYDYVRTNMKWNDRRSIYSSSGLKKAVSERKGNSADINLSLIVLLKDLGINASPVVLSTRDNGIIWEPITNQSRLNYVIACATVGGKKYLLDATDVNRPYTMLPFRCLNGKGILAIDDSVQWIDLLNSEKTSTRSFGEFKINTDGNVEGKMTITYDGYEACDNRDNLLTKGTEKYISDLKDEIKICMWIVSGLKTIQFPLP